MELIYRYRFEKRGDLIPSSGILKNEVWLDVGNSLKMGCFDHHHEDEYGSALMALLDNTKFLGDLKESADAQKEIIVHMHEGPDMDCVACWYVVKYFLEHERREFDALFGENGTARGILSYVNDIDAGKRKIVKNPTLYALLFSLDKNKEKSEKTDEYVVERGIELIGLAVGLLSEKKVEDLASYNLSQDSNIRKIFADEIQIIENSRCEYEKEKSNNDISFEPISIWRKDDSQDYVLEKVQAAIWKKTPNELSFGYIHAREEGNIVTIVPYSIKGRDGACTTQVLASIDPDNNSKKKYSLKPIVEIIEQMEQVEEQRLYVQTGRYRRDYSKPREASGRLSKIPFSTTSDPWFFNAEEDVFDAPRDKSLLDYADIIEVIRHNGSNVKKAYVLSIGDDNEPGVVYERKGAALIRWQQDVYELISNDTDYKIVFAELDSSLIRHSNEILKAYCMNLIGRSFHECNESRFLFLDYRTCIYADLNCVIIFVATHGDDSYSELPISGLLGVSTAKEIIDSNLVVDINKIHKQRLALLDYSKKIGELKERKDIEKLNDRFLRFSANVQGENVINNNLEREIYAFLKEEFEIDRLVSSVMDEMNILVNESRDRLVSKFNTLSSVAVPFVLIATVFQMGIIKFDEFFGLYGRGAQTGWIIVILIIIVLMVAILLSGTKKKDDED